MNCKICNTEVQPTFKAKVLQQFIVQYYTCSNCGFIQTENPFWLKEAYSNAITNLDIGLLYRNNIFKPIVITIINSFFNPAAKFVDYGGGYGVLVRTLRDSGFDFYRYDKYCDNLFAKGLDISDLAVNERFEILTAFEVFEHLENPLQEIDKMLEYSDNILFSTELVPDKKVVAPGNWWYLAPETGQHIAFYTKKSLKLIADRYSLNFYTNGSTLHLFTKKKINPFLFRLFSKNKVASIVASLSTRKSLLPTDFNYIREKII